MKLNSTQLNSTQLNSTRSVRVALTASLFAVLLLVGRTAAAQSPPPTYVAPVESFEGTDVSVYFDRTESTEFYCSSGGTSCQTQNYLQLKPGYTDAVIFLRGYTVVDDTSSPDRFEAVRVSVVVNNWDASTGQLEWESDAEFDDAGAAQDIFYTVEVTIILANRNVAGAPTVLSTSEGGSNCSISDTDSSPTCSGTSGGFGGSLPFIGAPVRSFALSTSSPIQLDEMGFGLSGVTTPFPGAVSWQADCTISGKTAASVGTAGTCSATRVALFAASGAFPWTSETTESATGQTVGWSANFDRRNLSGWTGPFAGLVNHNQAFDYSAGGGFGFTHLGGGCSATDGVDPIYGWDMFYYGHNASAQDVSGSPSDVEFDPSVRCLFGEIL